MKRILLGDSSDLLVSFMHKVYSNIDYKNSKLSGRSLIILPSNSSGECCFSNLEICRFCDFKSLGRILNSQIPKCLEEINGLSRKSASRVISNLCSDNDSSKTLPFEIVLGDVLTSCPSLDKNENNPLCAFSSNKNFILSRNGNHEIPFRNLGSKVQSCFDMLFSQRRVCFNDFFVTSSIFKHFQNYRDHDSGALESGLSVTDFAVNDDIIIKFDSHKANEGKEIFKSFDFLALLNYSDTNDTGEVEIHVKVPPDEPGGYKTSTVNFISSLGSNTL